MTISRRPLLVACAVSSLVSSLVAACGEPAPQAITIPFAGVVDGAPFACGERFDGVGTSGASVTAADFRLYVHNVVVVDEDGNDVVVTLDTDDFQARGVALLDFEDGTGACDTGSPLLHTSITGTIPGDVDLAGVGGVRFTLGVPNALNHLDAVNTDAPLNIPSLWWTWASGYKYITTELLVGADEDAAYFHLGSTTCKGPPEEAVYSCAYDNLIDVGLVWNDGKTIDVDLGAIFASVDLEGELAQGDMMRGCMSLSGDPECVGMFASVGMTYEDNGGSPTQTVFAVR